MASPPTDVRPERPPLETRAADLERLSGGPWDLLVIGGGIVGAGVLLDAVSRGLRAALVEQDDIAAGTSSRSSRLIHGGLRYLEDMRFHLVREALVERSRLLRLAPHLVRLERFLFTVYGLPLVHRAFYGSGLVLYDALGAARDGGRARHLGAGQVAELVPPIHRAGLRGGITYHDGVEDDARYTLAVLRTAMSLGAEAVTRVRATELLTDARGMTTGVRVRDLLSGEEREVRARMLVDATGVWAGRPDSPLGGSGVQIIPSRGSHLVVPRERIPIRVGMTLRIPGRVLFIIPWPNAWVIGTTDEPDAGAPERPAPTGHETSLILEMVNDVLDVDLTPADAVGAYAGLRPLVGVPGGDTVRVSREHKVHREESGLVRVSGGKYTTYRLMARDAVDVALDAAAARSPSRSADRPLVGTAATDALDRLVAELAREPGLDEDLARTLVGRHGAEARDVVRLGRELDLLRPLADDVPHLEAEVAWAVRRELALSLDDVLSRRLRVSMARRDRGASVAPRVAAIMGADLGWDAARRERQVAEFLVGARREYDVPGAPREDDVPGTSGARAEVGAA
jgi:glycerol-3-phosphate dehydrogenase